MVIHYSWVNVRWMFWLERYKILVSTYSSVVRPYVAAASDHQSFMFCELVLQGGNNVMRWRGLPPFVYSVGNMCLQWTKIKEANKNNKWTSCMHYYLMFQCIKGYYLVFPTKFLHIFNVPNSSTCFPSLN